MSRETVIAFRISVPASEEDMATALLWELGTLGIHIDENPGPAAPVGLLAYFPAGAVSLTSLGSCLEALPEVQIEDAAVPEVDWVARFREGFSSFDVGGFHVVPVWEANGPGSHSLIVDPARAFGTGTHESTRLCLRALESVAAQRALGRVLDVGCGTGILGVAAARLGGAPVVCVDFDAEAAQAAAHHGRLNRVELRVVCGDGCRAITGRFDVVLANIAVGPLLERREELCASVARSGTLLLSGLLESDLSSLLGAYGHLGSLEVQRDGEWASVMLRPAAA